MKYLIGGQDSYRAREFIHSLSAQIQVIDQPDAVDPAVLGLMQPSLFGAGKLTVFHNLLDRLGQHTGILINPSTQVVIWEEKDALKPPHNLKDHFQVREFKLLSPSQTRQWLDDQVRVRDLPIERRLLARLVDLHGSNLHLLSRELDKIESYCTDNPSTQLTTAEFDLLCHNTTPENIFNLLDAIGHRQPLLIRTRLKNILTPGLDEWYIFYLLVKHLRQLCQVKLGLPVKIHPYVLKKLTQQAHVWDKDHLLHRLQQLLQVELHVKRGESQLKPELVNWIFHTV